MTIDRRGAANTVLLVHDPECAAATVRLAGEFDLADQQTVRDAIDAALLWLPRKVTVDLREVTFIDVVAMRALLDGVRYAEHLHVEVTMATTRFQRRLASLLGQQLPPAGDPNASLGA